MVDTSSTQPRTTAPDAGIRRKRHRRAVRLGIYLPFAGAFLVILALTGVALAGGQAGTVANIFLTIAILCPLAICVLPIYVLFLALISLMGRANRASARGLPRLGDSLVNAEGRAADVVQRIAGYTIRWNSAFAFLDKVASRVYDSEAGTRSTSDSHVKRELP